MVQTVADISRNVFVLVVIIAGFFMNSYKYSVFKEDYLNQTSYRIFPWSKNPQTSGSDLDWLYVHLTVALLNVFLTGFMLINQELNDGMKKFLHYCHMVVHAAFSAMIIYNIYHFGEFSPLVACLANGIPLGLAMLFWALPAVNPSRLFLYFLAITAPIYFEIGMYAWQHLVG